MNHCFKISFPECVRLIAEVESTSASTQKDGFEAKDGQLAEIEGVENLFLGEKRGEICSDISLENLVGFSSNIRIHSNANPRDGHYIVSKVSTTPSKIRTKYCYSVRFKGPQLFSIQPKGLIIVLRWRFSRNTWTSFYTKYCLNRYYGRMGIEVFCQNR